VTHGRVDEEAGSRGGSAAAGDAQKGDNVSWWRSSGRTVALQVWRAESRASGGGGARRGTACRRERTEPRRAGARAGSVRKAWL
jgi:hypothetical protein